MLSIGRALSRSLRPPTSRAAVQLHAHRSNAACASASAYGESGATSGDEESLRWRKTYSLTGQGHKNQCTMRTEDGFEIGSDIPKAMGGGNSAPQPVFLLLSALAGCETATANFVARQLKMRLKGVSFELEAWRDQRGAISMPIDEDPSEPSMLQAVYGTAMVDTEASQEQIDAMAHQVHRRCPVASMMVAAGCRVDIKWVKASSL